MWLASGQQLVSDFHFVRRRLVITLLQADGKTPAANVACVFLTGEVLTRDHTTDRDGKLILDPAPAGPVHIQPRGMFVALGPVQIPVGQTTYEATLTLPSAERK